MRLAISAVVWALTGTASAQPLPVLACLDMGCPDESGETEGVLCYRAPERFRIAPDPDGNPVVIRDGFVASAAAEETPEGLLVSMVLPPRGAALGQWGTEIVRLTVADNGALTVVRLDGDGAEVSRSRGVCGYEPPWRP